MDREAWQATVHGEAKSQTRLSNWTHTHTHTHTHTSRRNKDEFRGQILRTVSLRNNQLDNLCQRKQNSWKRGKEFKTRITNMLEEVREDIGNIK